MKLLKKKIINSILKYIGFLFIYCLCKSLKIKIINKEYEESVLDQAKPSIYTFWHGRILYFPYYYKGQNKHHILVSPSPDGEIIGQVLKLFGFFVIWGSTFKQSRKALMTLIRTIKSGNPVVLIADGSRGPAFKVQQGTISIGKLTGSPIIPMSYGVKQKKKINSWDQFILPYPFSSGVLIYGKPIFVPEGASSEIMEEKRVALENELNRITFEADNYFVREK